MREVRRSSQSGFTLIECLVALAILGTALLFEIGLQWQARSVRLGLEVEARLLERATAAVESVRAGVHPLTSGPVDASLAWPLWDVGDDVVLSLEVSPTEVAGVCELEIAARSIDERGRWHSLELATRVWRPGAACS